MSEPTKAAMKAADHVISHISTSIVYGDASVAAIIDRETGLPELQAALRKLAEETAGDTDIYSMELYRIATDALRKAGEL